MTNAERGRATGQHNDRDQQAEMWRNEEGSPLICPTAFRSCCEAMEEMESDRPLGTHVDYDVRHIPHGKYGVMIYVSATFKHPERIQITRYVNLAPWQEAATAALKRQANEDAAFHCDICGAASGTCECAWTDTEAEREGERRGDEDRENA